MPWLASAGEREMKRGEDDEAQADEGSNIDIERGRRIILVKAGDMLSVAGLGWVWQHAKTGSTGMQAQGKAHATQATFCPSALNNTRIPPANNIPYRCVVMDSSMVVTRHARFWPSLVFLDSCHLSRHGLSR